MCLCADAAAQTNDHLFRSWRWPQESLSARAAGWGGLGTAAPDDATSLGANPAVLTSLTRLDVFAGVSAYGSGRAPVGDDVNAATALGASGAAARLSNRWALGIGALQPRAARLEVLPVRLADGSADVGSFELRATDLILAGSFRPTARLHLGAQLVRTGVHASGDYGHDQAVGAADIRVRVVGTATTLTGGFGLLYESGKRWVLGVSTLAGTRYRLERFADSPLLGVTLDAGSAFELVRPSTLSGGALVKLSTRLALGAQLDLVRYSEVPVRLVIGQGARSRDEYQLTDTLEPRCGVELSIPLRGLAVQVRAGIHGQAGGTPRFVGDDEVETSAFPGGHYEWAGAVGVSLVTQRGLRFDLAGRFGGERPAVLAGAAARF
jgi:hypothetical protein